MNVIVSIPNRTNKISFFFTCYDNFKFMDIVIINYNDFVVIFYILMTNAIYIVFFFAIFVPFFCTHMFVTKSSNYFVTNWNNCYDICAMSYRCNYFCFFFKVAICRIMFILFVKRNFIFSSTICFF